MLIDTHCHLNFKAFNHNLDVIIQRAQDNNVKKIIIPGAKMDSSQKAVEIAKHYPSCFAAVGIHPHHAVKLKNLLESADGQKEIRKQLDEIANNEKVVAVGEIGLDYYQYQGYPLIKQEEKVCQKKLFKIQLNLALERNLPVVLHSRAAHHELFDFLKKYLDKNSSLKGVFHCFEGDEEQLYLAVKWGFFLGFDGNITYPANKRLRQLVALTPLSNLLLETDSPYLAPFPFRGKPNEPANLPLIAEEIAKIKKTSREKIEKNTTRNAEALFLTEA